jgi:hypothetical protein
MAILLLITSVLAAEDMLRALRGEYFFNVTQKMQTLQHSVLRVHAATIEP